MFTQLLEQLPRTLVCRILVLRTAPIPQVRHAIEGLKNAYPSAEFWILGRQLDHSLFASMHKFEITRPWLNPRGYRPFRRAAARADFDLAVMCLNSDSWAGYANVSKVMKRIPAREKLVAGYSHEWYRWRHDLFEEGSWSLRAAVSVLEFVLLPLTFLVVAAMSAKNKYMPAGQGRTAPEYER